ncbi:NADPH-dependent FMN reductase [Demequina globuliformis]|uniref:NADPH-dependent FMN reductase n=1 Tax=Demequina globuliformis TaxID=676202 RepID=UPI0007850D23|nr:NADPH-dependent FMN reductase [Demequina globuliformis]
MTTLGLLIGSLPLARTQHHLTQLLTDSAPPGVEVTLLDPHRLPHHAPYSDVPTPTAAHEWKRALAGVDGLVVLTPTVERSIPGSLKNALDWAGGMSGVNTLAGLPTVIAGVSVGTLPRFAAIQHLRTVLGDAGAALRSQPETVLFAAPEAFDDSDTPVDADLVAEARDLMSAAAGLAVHERRAATARAATQTMDPIAEVIAAPLAPISPADGIKVA